TAMYGGQRQLGVRGRRGRDHDAVDARCQHLLDRICPFCTMFGSNGRNHVEALVGDDKPVDTIEAGQRVGVERADAAQSDYAESGHGFLRSSWSRSATSSCSAVRSSANAASTVST